MNELTFDDLADNPDLAKKEESGETPFRRQRSSIAMSSIRIVTEEELTRVKAKLYQDMEAEYTAAIRDHKNIQDTSVPTWLWIALAWFASDNVAGWLSSPIFFYPLIIISGICVVLHQMGVLKLIIDLGLPSAKA